MAFDGVGESTDLSTHCDVRAVRVFQVGAGPVQRLTAECGAMPDVQGLSQEIRQIRDATRESGDGRAGREKKPPQLTTKMQDRPSDPGRHAADVAQKKALVLRFTMPFTRDTFENTR